MKIGIDIGGTLIKLLMELQRNEPLYIESPGEILIIGSAKDTYLVMITFLRSNIKAFFGFLSKIKTQLDQKVVYSTGGGSYKYNAELQKVLAPCKLKMENEFKSLAVGLEYFSSMLNEFYYNLKSGVRETVDLKKLFPFLLVNIGSGVSMSVYKGNSEIQPIGGSSNGGSTFTGFASFMFPDITYKHAIQRIQQFYDSLPKDFDIYEPTLSNPVFQHIDDYLLFSFYLQVVISIIENAVLTAKVLKLENILVKGSFMNNKKLNNTLFSRIADDMTDRHNWEAKIIFAEINSHFGAASCIICEKADSI